ncbi:MAG: hypothetical protein JWP72_431 [Massilia sp.]|nr:hypothetical protein [Massilia sp.]
MALVRAALRGIDAIRAEVPDARFLHADPMCRVVPPSDDPAAIVAAHYFNREFVFESWDMLCGRRHPELGGSRAHLDVVGINYYWNCQWEHGADGTWLDDDDPRRLPLRDLVMDVWKRYGGEVVISETAHRGDQRARWLRQLGDEVEAMLDAGVPLRGVCLYPISGCVTGTIHVTGCRWGYGILIVRTACAGSFMSQRWTRSCKRRKR